MDSGQRKRRKWDVAGPEAAAPPATAGFSNVPPVPVAASQPAQVHDDDFVKRAKMVAAAIANRISQASAARGLASGGASSGHESRQEIAREVVINDAPAPIRFNLTKKPIQDDIASRTKTVIVTKGRYYAPGARVDDNEKALHLRVTPGIHAGVTEEDKRKAVDAAAAEIQAIMQGERYHRPSQSYNQQPPPGAAYSNSTQHSAPSAAATAAGPAPSCQLFVGINAPPEFGLAARLRGPGDQYIRHIGSSGAHVILRGMGSGMVESPEPLHFLISGPTERQVDAAKGLAQDLLTTVKKDFDRLYPNHPATAPPPHPTSTPMASYPPPSAQYPPPYSQAYARPAASYPPPATPYGSYPPPYQHGMPPSQYPGPQAATPLYHSQPQVQPATSVPPAQYQHHQATPYPPASYGPAAHPTYPMHAPAPIYPPPGSAQYPYPGPNPYAAPHMPYPPGAYPSQQAAAPGPYEPPPPVAVELPPPLPPSPPRRRFRESKEDQPQVAGPKGDAGAQQLPGGYAQSYPQLSAPSAGQGSWQLNTSAPPPAGSMGPPPPRAVMGPPPPKPPTAASSAAGGSEESGDAGAPMLKLVDYEGDD